MGDASTASADWVEATKARYTGNATSSIPAITTA
jgi:hypothetical protein